MARRRLAGTLGFLRSMAAPRLLDIAKQLQIARHWAAFEDLLDASPPQLILQMTPWVGPFSPPDERFGAGTLELTLEESPQEQIVARGRIDCVAGTEPLGERRVAVSRVSAAWIESAALDFVREVLARA